MRRYDMSDVSMICYFKHMLKPRVMSLQTLNEMQTFCMQATDTLYKWAPFLPHFSKQPHYPPLILALSSKHYWVCCAYSYICFLFLFSLCPNLLPTRSTRPHWPRHWPLFQATLPRRIVPMVSSIPSVLSIRTTTVHMLSSKWSMLCNTTW